MSENLKNKGYKNLVEDLQGIINNGQHQAYKAVDNIKVQTYWQIGERVVREELKNKDRADYGRYLINNLTVDLGIGRALLYKIYKFYKTYPIVYAVRRQLSWRHYFCLIELKDEKERIFYENKIITNSWSYRELTKQIKNQLYQNTNQKEVLDISKSLVPKVIDINKIFKPEYNLDFLVIEPNHQEKELEDKIVSGVESFLKELGGDFSFLGRQVPILIDNQKHFIDLLLYNHGIPCAILVDLKVGKLDSRDIGQMNKYVNYFRNNRQYIHEQDAIGLIICREIGHEEVIYALGGLEDRIFVSKYKTKLPSEAEIRRVIKNL